MTNPFVIQRPIRYGEPFCDRKAEKEWLLKRILGAEAVFLYSLRRYGKTSLVNQVSGVLASQGWETIFVDLTNVRKLEELALILKKALEKVYSSFWERLKGLAQKSPKMVLEMDPLTGKTSLSLKFEEKTTNIFTLETLLERYLELPKHIDRFLLLVIDEFQEIRQFSPDGAVEGTFRKVFQRRDEGLVPLFLGSRRRILKDMFESEKAPFYKGASPLELHEIPQEDYVVFVREEFRKTLHFPVPEKLLAKVWELFGGHPYLGQKFAARLWTAILLNKKVVLKDLAIQLCVEIIEEEKQLYSLQNKKFPVYVLDLFESIAENEPVKRPFSKEFLKNTGLVTTEVQRGLRLLEEQDKVVKTQEGWRVVDPSERLWLRFRLYSEEEVAAWLEGFFS